MAQWNPMMGISKEEFEKRQRKEKAAKQGRARNPKMAGNEAGRTAPRRKDHSDKIIALLDRLGKKSGPAADALASKDSLTEAQVQRALDKAERERKKRS